MEVKSLPKHYKHLSFVSNDISQVMIEYLKLALILVFCPKHIKQPLWEQDFGSSSMTNGVVYLNWWPSPFVNDEITFLCLR